MRRARSSQSLIWPVEAGASLGLRARALRALFAGLEIGTLTLRMPNGEAVDIRGRFAGPKGQVALRNWRPARRLLVEGDVGVARSFIDGDWESPDLPALIELAARNVAVLDAKLAGLAPARFLSWLAHLGNANTLRGSRRNIAFHYDLGNDFYRTWLDDRMIYSSALFDAIDLTLEEAQARKIERILALLDLSGTESLLEIGCGWGALAAAAAQRCSSVRAITLSTEQHAQAFEVVRAAGLSGKVDVRLEDYRNVEGRFDRIVSIEMLEAVGEAYWPTYFDKLRRSLNPGGTCVLQVITLDESRFERYRRGADFVQRFIFPGGMLPTKRIIADQAGRAGFALAGVESFGRSYAATLAEWRRRFLTASSEIDRLGFPPTFRRMWDYYLCYCEGGFRAGVLDVSLFALKG